MYPTNADRKMVLLRIVHQTSRVHTRQNNTARGYNPISDHPLVVVVSFVDAVVDVGVFRYDAVM